MPGRFPEEKMMRTLARVTLAVAALALTPALPVAAGDPPLAKKAARPSRGFAGIPAKSCRPGFTQAGPQLCVMEVARGPASFANAVLDCMDLGARVEDYHDWRFRTFHGDGAQATPGFWLGPITADN